jgi:glycosyltransferase involved in cell wall biosynthesis
MRILITTQILDRTDPGLGFFHRWVEVFASECESVHVVCLKKGEYDLPHNVTVTSLGKEVGAGRSKRLVRFFQTIWSTRHDYDAVFVHMNPEYIVAGGLLWRLMGKRIGLWYAHRTVDFKLRVAALFTHIAFTGSIESFRIDTPKRIVVGQGVDTSMFVPQRESHHIQDPTLVVVGRISPIKNLELAIDTIEVVRHTKPTARLRIVGTIGKEEDRPYLESLMHRVRERGLGDAVVFVGGRDASGVLEELRCADVFLHTSKTNSADKTAVEAMAVGLYQVTSSPVYQKDLPRSCVQESTPEAYAAEVLRYVALPNDERTRIATVMREAAIREHSLDRLVRLIVSHLRG